MFADSSLTHLYFVHSFIVFSKLIYQFYLWIFTHCPVFLTSPTSLCFPAHWTKSPDNFFCILYSHYDSQKKQLYVNPGLPHFSTGEKLMNFIVILCLYCPLSKKCLFIVSSEIQTKLTIPYSRCHFLGYLWIQYKLLKKSWKASKISK